jgi:hypothetical protein
MILNRSNACGRKVFANSRYANGPALYSAFGWLQRFDKRTADQ